jgi:outer membrane protein assembly factor BamB
MLNQMANLFKRKKNILNLTVCLVVLSLVAAGCAGPTFQGWSGFTEHEGILYFGGIDGRVFAISLEARSQNLNFPAENEWVFSVPRAGTPGTVCGPACAPASPQQSIYATPVVVGDLVCVGIYSGETGRLVAINRLSPGYTGGVPLRSKGEWMYPISGGSISMGAIVGSPVVVDDTLYVGSSDGKLYAINAVYGEEKWEFNTGGKIWTSPVVDNGVIYISNYEKKLFAVSADSGTQIWSTELPSSIASSPSVSTDSIFVGTFDNRLYAIDRTTGRVKWDFQGGNWFWSTPVVEGNTVYAGCLDHNVYAIDASTGKELWRFPTDGQVVSTPVLADGLLIVASNIVDSKSGEIYILDVNNKNNKGEEKSVVPVSGEVMAPLYAQGNMVYAHSSNFCVYGFNVETGQKVWEFCYSGIK